MNPYLSAVVYGLAALIFILGVIGIVSQFRLWLWRRKIRRVLDLDGRERASLNGKF